MRERFVLFIAIVLLCTQGVAGFTVSSFTVVPPGDVGDRTPVTVTCEIPRTGILLYDQLVIVTDLDSPVWEPVIVVHDRETPVAPASRDGNRLILNGAAFNYPEPVPVKLRLIVKGSVPANHTVNQTLLDIRHTDSGGTPYAWPSGNFTLPMPGPLSGTVPETGAPTEPAAEVPFPEYTVPASSSPATTEFPPATTTPEPEKTLSLPTPLPEGTKPKKAAPASPLAIAGAAGIAMLIVRKSSLR